MVRCAFTESPDRVRLRTRKRPGPPGYLGHRAGPFRRARWTLAYTPRITRAATAVDRDGVVALLGAIVRGTPSLPGQPVWAGGGCSTPSPAAQTPRAALGALAGRGEGLPGVPGAVRVPGIAVQPTWGKWRSRLQGNRWSGATFGKIDGSGQIGHLGYRVCRALVFSPASQLVERQEVPGVSAQEITPRLRAYHHYLQVLTSRTMELLHSETGLECLRALAERPLFAKLARCAVVHQQEIVHLDTVPDPIISVLIKSSASSTISIVL